MNVNKMSLDEICAELDALSIRMLHLMKEYIDVKINIEDVIKSGCLHLAKSRYIMGNRSVSALQLPTEDSNDVTASTKIISKENDTDDALSLELSRLNINDNFKSNDNEVRQRLKDNKKDDDSGESNTTSKSLVRDPLKWFGVLVPQDMRQAQSNFNKAIEYVVECANIQLEMLSIDEKYKKLLVKKRELSKQ